MRKDNSGFSLVELIVTFAIMAILVSILSVSFINQVEKAKATAALSDANVIYETAQRALILSMIDNPGSYGYAIKFHRNINGTDTNIGRFSSQSVYKYLSARNGNILQTGKSAKSDQYIASVMISSIPGTPEDLSSGTLQDISPISTAGISSLDVANNPDIYGDVVFAMAYTYTGTILYFQCVYKGYFIQFTPDSSSVEKVSDSLKFNNWPTSPADRRTDVNTSDW